MNAAGAGLYYNRARWYDAGTGRFLSEDPLEFEGGDANLYRYAAGDPVNFLDPTGQSWLSSIFKKIGKAFKKTLDFAENVINNPDDFIDNLDEIGKGLIKDPLFWVGVAGSVWGFGPLFNSNVTWGAFEVGVGTGGVYAGPNWGRALSQGWGALNGRGFSMGVPTFNVATPAFSMSGQLWSQPAQYAYAGNSGIPHFQTPDEFVAAPSAMPIFGAPAPFGASVITQVAYANSPYSRLPDSNNGQWLDRFGKPGTPGDSIFHWKPEFKMPPIQYVKGQPNLSRFVYEKNGIVGAVDIGYSTNLSKAAAHAADVRAANKAMDNIVKRMNPKLRWKPPSGYVWHHQGVSYKTGIGQMVLVKQNIHVKAVHEGARSLYSNYLLAKATGRADDLAEATTKLGWLGKIGRRAAGPLALFGTFVAAREGLALGGALGAGEAIMRDLVWADELEAAANAAANMVPMNTQRFQNSHRANLFNELEQYRSKE